MKTKFKDEGNLMLPSGHPLFDMLNSKLSISEADRREMDVKWEAEREAERKHREHYNDISQLNEYIRELEELLADIRGSLKGTQWDKLTLDTDSILEDIHKKVKTRRNADKYYYNEFDNETFQWKKK